MKNLKPDRIIRATLTDAWGTDVGVLVRYTDGTWEYKGLIPYANIPNLRWC